jgi:hypothetical protein
MTATYIIITTINNSLSTLFSTMSIICIEPLNQTRKHNNQPTILGCLKFSEAEERSSHSHKNDTHLPTAMNSHESASVKGSFYEPGWSWVQQNPIGKNEDEMCECEFGSHAFLSLLSSFEIATRRTISPCRLG